VIADYFRLAQKSIPRLAAWVATGRNSGPAIRNLLAMKEI